MSLQTHKRYGMRVYLLMVSFLILITLFSVFTPGSTAYAAAYVVSKTADTNDGVCNADCSLREAITAANASAANDTITFATGANGTITLTSALPNVANNGTLTITGNGTSNTIISGGGAVRSLTEVASGATLSVNGLRLTAGRAFNAGAINNNGTLNITNVLFDGNTVDLGGGALNNAGTATIVSSTFDNNQAQVGGAIQSASGSMTITASQITGNRATAAGSGAGIYSAATFTLTNSVIRGNTGDISINGGGFYNAGATATLNNSTIAGNQALVGGGVFNNNGTINLNNMIIADNTAGAFAPQCFSDGPVVMIHAQNSLIEGDLDCVNGTNTNNLTGDPALNGDLTLQSTSIAVDAGSNSLIPGGITTDLAGNNRIQGLRVDMGAFEYAVPVPNVTISPTTFNVSEGSNANFTISRTGATTSALAVTVNITRGIGTVATDYTLSGGSITGQNGSQTVTIPAGSASVNVNIAAANDIDAEADNTLTMALVDTATYNLGATTSSTATIPANDFVVTNTSDSGDGSLRQAITNHFGTSNTTHEITFAPSANGTITLLSLLPQLASYDGATLTITGNGPSNTIISGNDDWQVFYLAAGTITIQNLTITRGNDEAVGSGGGGIYNSAQMLTLNNTVFTNNTSTLGGGAFRATSGTITAITNSTFSNNSAIHGGALYTIGSMTLTSSTLSGNTSSGSGSAIRVIAGTLTITHSTISGNTSGGFGAIQNSNDGTVQIGHTILAGNTSGDGAGSFASLGYNIIGDTTGMTITGTTTGNRINTAASPLNLGALADNGGLTPTMALQTGSVAYNTGRASFTPPPSTDQRGLPRVSLGRIDIGAYESTTDLTATTLTVQLTLQGRPAAPNGAYTVSGEVEVRPTSGGAALLSTTFTANNLGQFVINNVPVGTYDIWVKGSHTLARLHEDMVMSVGGSQLTTALLLEGDANDDNLVTIVDFSILATAFGSLTGDAAYDARANFNQDGVISLVDFSLLSNNFSLEGAP